MNRRRPPAPLLKAFGMRLKNFREQNGISLSDMASAVGIRRQTLRDIENGEVNPSLDKILIACAIFKVTPTELLPPVPKINLSEKPKVIKVTKNITISKPSWK
jgi:transcriptional regulator with XRE-family HTH domain